MAIETPRKEPQLEFLIANSANEIEDVMGIPQVIDPTLKPEGVYFDFSGSHTFHWDVVDDFQYAEKDIADGEVSRVTALEGRITDTGSAYSSIYKIVRIKISEMKSGDKQMDIESVLHEGYKTTQSEAHLEKSTYDINSDHHIWAREGLNPAEVAAVVEDALKIAKSAKTLLPYEAEQNLARREEMLELLGLPPAPQPT